MDVAVTPRTLYPSMSCSWPARLCIACLLDMPCRIIGSVHSRVCAFMCSRVRASVRSESSERSPAILRASAREWLYPDVYGAVIIAAGMICLRVDAYESECGIFLLGECGAPESRPVCILR